MTSPESGADNPRKILLVDDEAPIRRALCREFRRAGFQPFDYETPGEAIEHLGTHASTFDVALLDYYMPRMDGVDLARRIRVLQPDLPVVLLTAGYLEGDTKVEDALSDGTLKAVLSKPWNRAQLLDTMKQIVSRQG